MKHTALVAVLALMLSGCGSTAPATRLSPTLALVPPATVTAHATASLVLPTAVTAHPTASPVLSTESPIPATATHSDSLPEATSPATSTPIAPSYFNGVRVTYIFNAGFLITAGDKRILIDGLYEGYPEGILKPLLESQPPFDGVDLILATHEHVDHFSTGFVRHYMLNNPGAVFASTQGAAAQLLALGDDLRNRVTAVQVRRGESERIEANGITVDAICLSHGTSGLLNLGFIITIGDVVILHTGDIDLETVALPDLRPYELPERQIDIAFVPADSFTEEEYYPLLQEGIGARTLIPMHFYGKLPMPASFASLFPQYFIFSESYESWVLPADTGAGLPLPWRRFTDKIAPLASQGWAIRHIF